MSAFPPALTPQGSQAPVWALRVSTAGRDPVCSVHYVSSLSPDIQREYDPGPRGGLRLNPESPPLAWPAGTEAREPSRGCAEQTHPGRWGWCWLPCSPGCHAASARGTCGAHRTFMNPSSALQCTPSHSSQPSPGSKVLTLEDLLWAGTSHLCP